VGGAWNVSIPNNSKRILPKNNQMTNEQKIWLALQSAKTDIILAIADYKKPNHTACMDWVDQATTRLMEAYGLLEEDKGGYEL
jgi:hypothetical protein